ncbi:hypothetical protein KIN20_027960 [Parelaphostrongylus tenuis]|uniref:Uncharacterized protein n=1 Tax=Parelaphostrongylus tenuis TaxID=148309 RepID=A0AAD5R012_PARTN|nr:hypothetical protein KIN20_027960 [Parelaphostrongylus tenuis]
MKRRNPQAVVSTVRKNAQRWSGVVDTDDQEHDADTNIPAVHQFPTSSGWGEMKKALVQPNIRASALAGSSIGQILRLLASPLENPYIPLRGVGDGVQLTRPVKCPSGVVFDCREPVEFYELFMRGVWAADCTTDKYLRQADGPSLGKHEH